MIRIFEMKNSLPTFFIRLSVILLLWQGAKANADGEIEYPKDLSEKNLPCSRVLTEIIGLNRSEESWLRDYLALDEISIGATSDLSILQKKIMTTDIFTSANVKLEEANQGVCKVKIFIEEKWTRIPVIRGVYGGGTPLLILGGYETNAFGRLLAIGGEVRRYGNRPAGAFAFFKSPRAWRGLGLWGGELWLDRRRRLFYDESGEAFGYADSESFTTKIQLLYPLGKIGSHGALQAGFHFQVSRESPSSFTRTADATQTTKQSYPDGVLLNDQPGWSSVIGGIGAFDDVAIHGLNMDGLKGRVLLGVSNSTENSGGFAETEWFGYSLLPKEINIATHAFLGSTTDRSLGGIYYLGGFDSIRGLPDGIHFGNKIAYANFEARVIVAKFKYAHIQPAFFIDTGAAWIDGNDPGAGRETSVGSGVRISIPQVYRLILRIDYGVSIGTTKSRGVSIGLNQFFQPYKLTF